MIMEDINVQMVILPTSIASFVVANQDMSYTILLNSKMSQGRLLQAYDHEVRHIANGDYDKKCTADLIELYTHN